MADDRLTVLSEYFHPESSATSQLLTELSTGLADSFKVASITTFPNYHEENRDANVARQEEYQDIKITRVWSTCFGKDVLWKRLINWFTYTITASSQLLRTPSDIVVVVSNPPTLPLATWLRKWLRGTPYVYLVHDLYPDIAVELNLINEGGVIEYLWRYVNGQLLADANQIVVLGESMKKAVLSQYETVTPSQITIIHNWEDETFIQPISKSENSFAHEQDTIEPFTIIYSGNIGRFHELKTVIDAIDRLEQKGRNVKLLIIGEGARKSELKRYVSENNISSVKFLPFQPIGKLPESLTCGDVSLVGIKEGMEGLCVSSKLYSALAGGQPILATVGKGDEVETVVRNYNAGIHVIPGNVESCIEAIERWMDDPELLEKQGKNARSCLEERFTFEGALQRYESVLNNVVGKQSN